VKYGRSADNFVRPVAQFSLLLTPTFVVSSIPAYSLRYPSFLGVVVPELYSSKFLFLGANLFDPVLSPAEDKDITLGVLRVNIKLLLADVPGVRGGWKMTDFAPDNRGGGAVLSREVWKVNAPGIALGEFVIVADYY
jgi:hypothetical protein